MKKLIAVSIVAVFALTSGAQASGFFSKRTSLLSNITGIVTSVETRDVNLLNGNTVAVGNNSSILSGIGNGNANGNTLGLGILNGNTLQNLLGGGGKKRHY